MIGSKSWKRIFPNYVGDRLNRASADQILYALEHGLNESEVAELRQEIHEWLEFSGRTNAIS